MVTRMCAVVRKSLAASLGVSCQGARDM